MRTHTFRPYFLCFVFLLASVGISQADWFTPTPPKAGTTAIETAGIAPKDSVLVVSWNLKGQIDLVEYLQKVRAVGLSDPSSRNDLFDEAEQELRRPLPEFVNYFSGNGFVSVLGSSNEKDKPPVVVAMELERPKAFAKWIVEMMGFSKSTKMGDFKVYFEKDDDISLGYNSQWCFFAYKGRGTQSAVDHLSGLGSPIERSQHFQNAFKELDYEDSGLALYMDTEKLQSILLSQSGTGLVTQSLLPKAVWDYGVGAANFKTESADLILRLSPVDSNLKTLLARPGVLTGEMGAKVPDELGAYVSLDGAWYARFIDQLGIDSPEFGLLYNIARQKLNQLGDIEAAFSGPLVFGTDFVDRLYPGSTPPNSILIADVADVEEARLFAQNVSLDKKKKGKASEPHQTSAGPSDSRIKVDAQEKEFRVTWGPGAEALINRRPGSSRTTHPLVKDALQWAKGELLLLSFFDFSRIAKRWRNIRAVESEDYYFREFVRQFLNHSRLQGVIAVKSNATGIRYRLRGLSASPAIPAGFFIGGFSLYRHSRVTP